MTGRAFTLIELLVVIAIIALLIGILVPSLSGARSAAKLVMESAAGRSLMEGVALYAGDYKSAIIPGYPPATWIAKGQVVNQHGKAILGPEAQRYPWRLLPYLDYNLQAIYKDKRVLSSIMEGGDNEYVVSLYPSLGMNVVFVGGSVNHLAFDKTMTSLFGQFYVTRIENARRPDKLIAFASARSEEPAGLGIGKPDGFFRVEPPTFGAGWQPTYDASAMLPGINSGFVAMRRGNRAVISALDGHAETLKYEDIRDMRRWADGAESADWKLEPKK